MNRRLGYVFACLLGACGTGSGDIDGEGSSAAPLFVNGGFETGTFSSWTKSSALNSTGLAAVPPTSSAQLQLSAGGKDFTFAKTNATPQSQLPAGLVAATGVPMWPRLVQTSAAINEWGPNNPTGDSNRQGANKNVNSIKQSMVTTAADVDPADGKVHVRFVLAPVLEAAGHDPANQPYFFVIVRNTTAPRVGTIYTSFNFANQAGVPWQVQGTGPAALLYTDWQIFDISPTADEFLLGDTIEVEVYASGCQPGGHAGSAYVDGFGASLPSLLISKTAPVFANVDSDITYSFTVTNATSGVAPNVVADEVLPPNTTFVSYSAPTATSCTVPAVGATGTVACTYGWMNPGQSEKFSVTVHAFTPITQGNVTASTTTTVTDGLQAWATNAYRGYTAFITSGPQAGQQGVIASNTATVLTVNQAFATAPAVGSSYKVLNPPAFVGTATSGSNTGGTNSVGQLSRTGSGWPENAWLGYTVHIVAGTGAGQSRSITSNTATLLTTSNWTTPPNNTSVFVITKPVQEVVNGNYGVSGVSVSRLLGPKRETTISAGKVVTDLSITKTNSVPAVVGGSGTTYTITVSNDGPNSVTNASVVDTLSSQFTGATWSCAATGGGVCAATGSGSINQLVTLPVNAKAVFTLNATVVAGTGATVSNVASVTVPSGVTETFPDNNASADTDALTSALRLLTVNKDSGGTGSGTVVSSPAAIDCGTGCTTASASFADGALVTLTAFAASNNRFLGWSGGGCSGTASTCTVTMSAAQTVTVTFTTCGNNLREAGEGCDDGGILDGDGCNSVCKIEETLNCNATPPGATGSNSCASGICDATGNVAPGKCEAAGVCGNSVREAGEGCDDGNTTAGDGCNASCLLENAQPCGSGLPGLVGASSCVSGVCNALGNPAPGKCEPAGGCGNSARETGEGCDDGNLASGDGCSSSCLIENGRGCNAAAPGVTGSVSCASGVCDAVGNSAPGLCEASGACGNSVRESGEGCDDGNTTGGDGCNGACLIETGGNCANTSPGLQGSASCAGGVCDAVGNAAPGKCENSNTCGNGIREAGEGCDDGNPTSGDGCSATCLIDTGGACNASAPGLLGNASCTSGLCDTTGNAAPGVCEAPSTCGNGLKDASEGCDDGNNTAGDGCSASCLIENGNACGVGPAGLVGGASCAGGVCNSAGFAAPGRCDSAGACGNGVREAGEGCDDGNNTAGDGCNGSCRVENGHSCNASGPGVTGDASCVSERCDLRFGSPGVCTGETPLKDTDGDGVPDADDLDDDNDGLSDALEGGPDTDTDGDGVPDRLDLDTDNDGVLDAREAGHRLAVAPDGTVSCPGGFGSNGLCDEVETAKDSGRSSFKGDGSETTSGIDTDGDGVPDFRDLDSDNDGLFDVTEGGSTCTIGAGVCTGTDTDGDGVVGDADQDPGRFGAGLRTEPPDTDKDGIADFRDLDSDNDGLTDLVEGGSGCADTNQDALCDTPRTPAEVTAPTDTDGDGVPDFRDLDSDNDAQLDRAEGGSPCTDADRDGVCDAGDEDGDGIVDTADGRLGGFGSGPDKTAPIPDRDGDGSPDFQDVDSDGDGVFDIVDAGFGGLDGDNDGRADGAGDGDGDGIVDTVDIQRATYGGGVRPATRLIGGGCNCSSDGDPMSSALPFLFCVLVWIARRQRALALVLLLATAGSASAQTSSAINVQNFKPGTGRHDILNVLSTETCGPMCSYTALWLQYAMNPLVLVDSSNTRLAKLVDNQLTADFVTTWGITKAIDIGLHLPVHIQSMNDSDYVNGKFAGRGWSVGAGDLRLVPRMRFWAWDMGLSIGLALPIVIPTGRPDAFMGGGFIGLDPRVLLGFRRGALHLDANVGVNLRKLERLANVAFGNEFAWALGGEYRFDIDKPMLAAISLLASVHGVVGFVGGPGASNRAVEVDGGLRWIPNKNWTAGLMAGRGLLAGYGSPDFRVAANVSYSFDCSTTPNDADGDHIPDAIDKCINDPEDYDSFEDGDGCPDPDNDKDGILDAADHCPMYAENVNGFEDEDGCPEADADGDGIPDCRDQCPKDPETKNGYQDEDGCPDGDRDGDGLRDDVDKCPDAPEDKDGFEDGDGCPDPDNDKDGIADVKDKCPLVPETINGVEDDDGCPDKGASQVKVEGNKIVILDKVYFATGKDVILDRSFNLLSQVASVLAAHTEIKKLRVEGHTDDQGDDKRNEDLSQRRANNVRKFLIEHGVDEARLVAQGYGEARPVASNKTPMGREMNRRVEFVVVESAP